MKNIFILRSLFDFIFRGFTLEINNLKNINYLFKRNRLLHEIKPEQSSYKVNQNKRLFSYH